MSVKCTYATYTLRVKFPIILIYKALYLPYTLCPCQNPVSTYSIFKNITPASTPKTVTSVKQSNFMTGNVVTVTELELQTDILSIPQPTTIRGA